MSPVGSPDQSARPTCKRARLDSRLATQRAQLAMITFNTTPPSPMQSPVGSPTRGRSRRCSMEEIVMDSINEDDDLLTAAANLAVKSRSASRATGPCLSTTQAAHHAAAFFEQ